MKALLLVMLATGVASAHPIGRGNLEIVGDPDPILIVEPPARPPPPPPAEKIHTRIGLRYGAGKQPIDHLVVTSTGVMQITGDILISDRVRMFADYELLMLGADISPDHELSGFGHRGNLGLLRELAAYRSSDRVAKFDISAEIGGGAMLTPSSITERVLPHGLVGLRGGFSLHPEHEERLEPSFGFELLVRAIVVPEGVGLTFGIGLQWGE